MDYKKLKSRLKESIENSSKVVITSHKRLDIDAISSAIGLYNIVDEMGKDAVIVIDDPLLTMEAGVKRIIDDVSIYTTICTSEELKNIDEKTILITTDVNKANRICLQKQLNKFKDIIVIDHHVTDEKTINTPDLFVDENISSACEIVGRLLAMYDLPLSHQKLYSYIYAGIVLDSKNFTKKTTTADTFTVGSYLIAHGANVMISNSLFVQTFDDDRRFQNLVSQADFYKLMTATAMDKECPTTIYNQEDLAKAADYLLQFESDAAFAVGLITNDNVYISARSKGDINVENIMKRYGGGGNACSAASKIKTGNILDVYQDLNDRLKCDTEISLKYILK